MTSMSRRAVLAGAPAALALAALPADAVARGPVEAPALVALARPLANAVAEARAAQTDYAACIERWSPLWPAVPDALRFDGRYHEAKAFDGSVIYEGERAVGVMTSEGLEADRDGIRRALSRKRKDPSKPFWADTRHYYGGRHSAQDWYAVLEQIADLMAIALVYEAEQVRIHSASGFKAKVARLKQARADLYALVSRAMAERPLTAGGVLTQAKAMQALQDLDWSHRIAALSANWSSIFAASVLRVSQA